MIYFLNLFLHINLFSVLAELSARHKQFTDEWHVIQDSQGLAVSFEQPYTKETDSVVLAAVDFHSYFLEVLL